MVEVTEVRRDREEKVTKIVMQMELNIGRVEAIFSLREDGKLKLDKRVIFSFAHRMPEPSDIYIPSEMFVRAYGIFFEKRQKKEKVEIVEKVEKEKGEEQPLLFPEGL